MHQLLWESVMVNSLRIPARRLYLSQNHHGRTPAADLLPRTAPRTRSCFRSKRITRYHGEKKPRCKSLRPTFAAYHFPYFVIPDIASIPTKWLQTAGRVKTLFDLPYYIVLILLADQKQGMPNRTQGCSCVLLQPKNETDLLQDSKESNKYPNCPSSNTRPAFDHSKRTDPRGPTPSPFRQKLARSWNRWGLSYPHAINIWQLMNETAMPVGCSFEHADLRTPLRYEKNRHENVFEHGGPNN